MKNPLPKVLHKVVGKTLIENVLDTVTKFSPKLLIPILSPDVPEVIDLVKNKYPKSQIIFQKEKLGTGHAVKLTLKKLKGFKGIIIALYGDTPFIEVSTIKKMAATINDKTALCVLGFEQNSKNQYGRLVCDVNNRLKAIVEFKEAAPEHKKITLCNSGVMAFNGKYIEKIINKIDNKNSKGEYYLTDAVHITNGMGYECSVITADADEVMGINSQAERAMAEKMIQEKLRQKHLDNGVILTDPASVYFSKETEIAPGVIVEPFVVFKGKVKISEGAEIRSFSHLEDCVVKKNAIIGPYARLRPGADIGDEARIGNFVEVKKSKIGKGSKVNHLSYIGDTEMGVDVNVGAGTITCNYDGYNKFKTKIEDGAFIGSNTEIIAPVKIGKKAVIGAGTTVIKDAPANKITINEKKQKSLTKDK